jgi:6-pyruvoyltetrahydropterin/6-carboxytetrahydropterin synthase
MSKPEFEITKAAAFDAAHRLPQGAPDNRYTRLHGHSFRVEATLRGPALGAAGWVDDLGVLDRALKEIAGALDHSLLNDQPGLENPTLETLCLYFAQRLHDAFPNLRRIAVSRPSIGERCVLEV